MPIAIVKSVEMYGRKLILVETYEEKGTKTVITVPFSEVKTPMDAMSYGEQVLAHIGSKNSMVILEQDDVARKIFDYIAEVIIKHRLTESLNIVEKVYS